MLGQDLFDLARETSPDQRNALLRRITDMFFDPAHERNISESVLFEEVVLRVMRDVDAAGRAELAHIVADHSSAPRRLVMGLARDEISVARPVLERSEVLSPEDLSRLAVQSSDDHRQAISRRKSLPEMVTDVLLEYGSGTVYRVLAGNGGARFSLRGFDQMVERSHEDEEMQRKLAARSDLPETIIRNLANLLSSKLDKSLKTMGLAADGAMAPALLQQLQARLSHTFQERDRETREVEHIVADIRTGRTSIDKEVIPLARQDRAFDIASVLAELTDVDHTTAMMALTGPQDEPIVVLFRALDASWDAFEAVLQLRAKRHRRVYVKSAALSRTYAEMDQMTAKRVLRFLQIRKSVEAHVA